MITKEKRREYNRRYREKHPDRCREQYKKWCNKNKVKKLTKKVDDLTRDAIPKLQQGLERANAMGLALEKENAQLKAENQRLRNLCGKVKEYLNYSLHDHQADSVLPMIDFIYNSEDTK